MYEMLAGKIPFDGADAADLLDQIATKTPTPISQLRKSVPPLLVSIVEKCLEKNREDRFADAGELADALMSVDTANYVLKNGKTASGASVRSFFGMWAVWGAGAIAVLVILLIATDGLSYLTRPSEATPEVESPEKQEPPPSSEAYQNYLRGKFYGTKGPATILKRR